MKKFLKIAGVATLVAIVGVVAVGAVAFAQGPPWKPPFPARIPFHRFMHQGAGPMGMDIEQAQAYREKMLRASAEALGMRPDELEAAIAEGQTPCQIAEAQGVDPDQAWEETREARQALLEQAVEDELLTRKQADWISGRMGAFDAAEWCEAGGGPGFLASRGGHLAGGPLGVEPDQVQAYHEQLGAAFAQALGMRPKELEAALAAGQTPCQIAEAQGLEPDQVWEATQEARQALLQQAVEDELLTQKQADWIGARMAEQNPGEWCQRRSGHGPWGKRGGLGGFPAPFHGFDR